MRRLRDLGASLSIDDFGTGYSALAYLRTFELQQLKIDRSFVAGLGDDIATATVQAIIDLAHAHRLEVVAEGVEEQWQADRLLAMGCDLGQGWLFGRPAPAHPPGR
jgi:EAL domain-containing protein (putative c-di-GMP-specific phosphodiesterase class I)